jgi:mono/diheme cytochrome c family protein
LGYRMPLAVAGIVFSLAAASSAEPAKHAADKLARGKYLVEQAGMCQDCHTPRTRDGGFDRSNWLLGSSLGFKPLAAMPWMPVAPPIAGLPTLTHAQAVHFLMTGERPGKPHVTPPMPEYRFSKADAEAIASYLKSLAE